MLAFQIYGHQDFDRRLIALDSHLNEQEALQNVSPEQFNDIKAAARKQVAQMSLQYLEDDLLDVAWASGVLNYFRTRKIIKRLRARVDGDLDAKADAALNQYFATTIKTEG